MSPTSSNEVLRVGLQEEYAVNAEAVDEGPMMLLDRVATETARKMIGVDGIIIVILWRMRNIA